MTATTAKRLVEHLERAVSVIRKKPLDKFGGAALERGFDGNTSSGADHHVMVAAIA